MQPERQYALVVGVGLAAFAAALFPTESLGLAAAVGVACALVAYHATENPEALRPTRVRDRLPRYALGAVAAVVAGGFSRYADAAVLLVVANALVWGAATVYLAATWQRDDSADDVGFLTTFAALLPMVVLADRLSTVTFALVLGYGLLWLGIGSYEYGS